MITQAQIYWITRLDAFCGVLVAAIVMCFIVGIIMGISAIIAANNIEWSNDHERKWWICSRNYRAKLSLASFVVALIILALGSFVPTTKEMAAIIVIPKVANNESLQDLGRGIVDLANIWLEELKPQNQKGGK